MQALEQKLEPADAIAFLVIIGGFIMMAIQPNDTANAVMMLVVGYYFGKKGRTSNLTDVKA